MRVENKMLTHTIGNKFQRTTTKEHSIVNLRLSNTYLLSLENVNELQLLAETFHQLTALPLQHLHAILRRRRTGLVGISTVLIKIDENMAFRWKYVS